MEKQQTLRRSNAGAGSSCAAHQAQKSLATQPRGGAPHRSLELRNQILARAESPPPAPAAGETTRAAPVNESNRRCLRKP
jgi:hypothetical protein